MRSLFTLFLSLLFLFQVPVVNSCAAKASVEEQQQGILKRSREILAALYGAKPEAREAVEKAYGYATFSDTGVKILVAGGGRGRGVAINNKTGEKTFMRMGEIQAGLGFGIKKFSLIWVFENKKAFESFLNSSVKFGGQGTVAVKPGVSGISYQGAVAAAPGAWLYQMTEKGLALEITVKGTKYSKDGKLNK